MLQLRNTHLCNFVLGVFFFNYLCVVAETEVYDVLVYKANAAGIAAAVTASKFGTYTVKIVEPLRMIGGMAAAGGVALMNQGGCGLSGLSGNWSRLVSSYYGLPEGVVFPRMKESERAFWELLNSSATIKTTLGCHAIHVERLEEGCLGRVTFQCDDESTFEVRASYIIDASYDGDIMTMGGVDHVHGREPRSTYNESLAGFQVREYSDEESFVLQNISIDPYNDNGTLLKYIGSEPMQKDGTGDDKLMAFEYFVCVSATAGNKKPFSRPPNYKSDDFLLLLRQIYQSMANGKYPRGPPFSYFADVQCYDPVVQNVTGNVDCLLCCGRGPVNSDQPGLNDGWATSNYTTRQEIAANHRYYVEGSLYFLANDPRVPNYTRQDSRKFGYCKDEYEDFENFPPQLYVRISNRLVGQKTLTQNNLVNPRVKVDGVAMGCWPFDQHTTTRHVVEYDGKPMVRNEGFFRALIGPENSTKMKNSFAFYDVPFGVMVPAKNIQGMNLLVPVCISASSVAYSSTRIENMFMDLGSAAGVAVANLLDKVEESNRTESCPPVDVQSVDVSAVQKVLGEVYQQRFHGIGVNPSFINQYSREKL